MIRSFKDKEAARLFQREKCKKIPINLQRSALRKLKMIHRAQSINDLRVPPANHLEQLKGNRLGQYSVRINNKWRICFLWAGNNAYDLEITNYH